MRVASVTGAELAPGARFIRFQIPGQGADAVHHTILLHLAR